MHSCFEWNYQFHADSVISIWQKFQWAILLKAKPIRRHTIEPGCDKWYGRLLRFHSTLATVRRHCIGALNCFLLFPTEIQWSNRQGCERFQLNDFENTWRLIWDDGSSRLVSSHRVVAHLHGKRQMAYAIHWSEASDQPLLCKAASHWMHSASSAIIIQCSFSPLPWRYESLAENKTEQKFSCARLLAFDSIKFFQIHGGKRKKKNGHKF